MGVVREASKRQLVKRRSSMGNTYCHFDKDAICGDLFGRNCSALQYCKGNFHSNNFKVNGLNGDRFVNGVFNGTNTTVDTGSCTSQMLYMASQGTSSWQGNTRWDKETTSTIRCEDDMSALTVLATVTSCLGFLLLIIFGIMAFVSANKKMDQSNKPLLHAVMAAALLGCSIPALAGCWSFLTRTATYEIGPADQVGFWILYLIFAGPVLCSWPCVAMCGGGNEADHCQDNYQTSTAAGPDANGAQLYNVDVPEGAVPGDQVQVQFPTGLASVVVPPGHAAGSKFQVLAPAASAVPSMQPQSDENLQKMGKGENQA